MTPTTATNPTRSRFVPAWRTCLVPSASVLAVLCLLFDSPVPAARAAETGRNNSNAPAVGGTGAVEGRVFNLGTGEFLERARVTIEGTSLETFTDNLGQYLFPFVPAGQARVKAFYTGLVVQTAPVAVLAGQRAQQDFNLAGLGKELPADDGTVKLSQFVVSTSKEMDGAAIAINEQRFAANIRTSGRNSPSSRISAISTTRPKTSRWPIPSRPPKPSSASARTLAHCGRSASKARFDLNASGTAWRTSGERRQGAPAGNLSQLEPEYP